MLSYELSAEGVHVYVPRACMCREAWPFPRAYAE